MEYLAPIFFSLYQLMDLYKSNPKIDAKTILSYVSQEDIMEKYLGISPNIDGMFCSPLREDENPTCTFAWIDGKLLFRDWAREYPLDCFGIVMKIYNVNYYEAQKIIAEDFDIVRHIRSGKKKKPVTFKESTTNKDKCTIEVKVQPFTKDNITYLQSYNLTSDIVKKFNVYCPKYVWLNGKIYYTQDDSNPALAYYFGLDEHNNQKWKIYFYKGEYTRFITNTNRINGWVQIPNEGDTVIFTKSLKDVMCFDIFDIPAVSMQAESQMPYDYIIKELKNRFKKIISVFDYDEAGIRRAVKMNEEYDIPYYFIQDEHAKDFSDYIQYYGKDKTTQLLTKILNT